jgi:hypothetical protein
MGLKNMSVSDNSLGITADGGNALVFADDGITITNGVHLIVPADVDFQTRRQVTAKYKPPTLDLKTGAYGKDKKSMSYAIPIILSDGRVIFNTIRLEREVHPSATAEANVNMNRVAAQLLTDAEALNFWANGSLS